MNINFYLYPLIIPSLCCPLFADHLSYFVSLFFMAFQPEFNPFFPTNKKDPSRREKYRIVFLECYPQVREEALNQQGSLDPPLARCKQVKKNEKMTRKILKAFDGQINFIICSPYLAARQTADFFLSSPSTDIHFDGRFGKYLGDYLSQIFSPAVEVNFFFDEQTSKYHKDQFFGPVNTAETIEKYQSDVNEITDEIIALAKGAVTDDDRYRAHVLQQMEENSEMQPHEIKTIEAMYANLTHFQEGLWYNKNILIITHRSFMKFAHLRFFGQELPDDIKSFRLDYFGCYRLSD